MHISSRLETALFSVAIMGAVVGAQLLAGSAPTAYGADASAESSTHTWISQSAPKLPGMPNPPAPPQPPTPPAPPTPPGCPLNCPTPTPTPSPTPGAGGPSSSPTVSPSPSVSPSSSPSPSSGGGGESKPAAQKPGQVLGAYAPTGVVENLLVTLVGGTGVLSTAAGLMFLKRD